MSDFEMFLCCLMVPSLVVLVYVAGRLDLLDHFLRAASNAPLTLDELKEAGSDPLWLVDEGEQWISVYSVEDGKIYFHVFGSDQLYFLWICSYGTVSSIYRRKPQ